MSEAVNNVKPDDFLPNPTVPPADSSTENQTPEADDRTNGEWQTVDFPNAMSVDAIPGVLQPLPEEGSDHDSSSSAAQTAPDVAKLQQENTVLRQQVSQLEEDLAQLQIELQLEVARFYCKDSEQAQEQTTDRVQTLTEELTRSQEQIQELTQTVERSHETIEQQQSFLETLTQELENSQQRVAQLERECALSQQRYNEQMQLVSQAENTCADLRMRLHRQQQQTLQFKAALEKSVEMNAFVQATYSEAAEMVTLSDQDSGEQSFLPKAKPVQPWNNLTGKSIHRSLSVPRAQVNLFSKLAESPQDQEAETDSVNSDTTHPSPEVLSGVEAVAATHPTPSSSTSSNHVLDELFPTLTDEFKPISQVQAPNEAIFDLSPFVEAGEINIEHISSSAPVQETSVHQPIEEVRPAASESALPVNTTGDGLWADLARLIEPDVSQESVELASQVRGDEVSSEQPQPVLQETVQPKNPFEDLQDLEISPKGKSISLVSFSHSNAKQDAENLTDQATPEAPVLAHSNPFPSFTLRPVKADEESMEAAIAHQFAEPGIERVETPSIELETSVPANWPSPTLYPFRQPKKIPSMAAVDLPTFPR